MPLVIRPMLALRSDKAGPIKLPVLAQPKLDGIRALVVGGKFQSRSGEPIANRLAQGLLSAQIDSISLGAYLEGADGELVVGPPTDPDSYRTTASTINSHMGPIQELRYYIFDWSIPKTLGARDRYKIALNRVAFARNHGHKWVNLLCTDIVHDLTLLEFMNAETVEAGYEGMVTRYASAPYHNGRAGKRAQQLLKWKNFLDTELEIVGFEELLHNENPDERSNLDYAKRSSAKAGKVPSGTLGAFVCRWKFTTVNVGTGFSQAEREEFWWKRDTLLGKTITVRYFPHGEHEKPRHPSFKGFRDPSDLDAV